MLGSQTVSVCRRRNDTIVTRRRWVSVALAMTLVLMACEYAVTPNEPEDTYVSQIDIRGFELLRVLHAAGATAVYFGPSSFDARNDVESQIALSPVEASGSSGVVAQGDAVTDDGVQCSVEVWKSSKNVLDYWSLSSAQAERVRAGSHIVVEIQVHCTSP